MDCDSMILEEGDLVLEDVEPVATGLLRYAVLYYAVLNWIVLCCGVCPAVWVLCCIVLCYAVLWCTMLRSGVWCWAVISMLRVNIVLCVCVWGIGSWFWTFCQYSALVMVIDTTALWLICSCHTVKSTVTVEIKTVEILELTIPPSSSSSVRQLQAMSLKQPLRLIRHD
jgi:hypothetical protein